MFGGVLAPHPLLCIAEPLRQAFPYAGPWRQSCTMLSVTRPEPTPRWRSHCRRCGTVVAGSERFGGPLPLDALRDGVAAAAGAAFDEVRDGTATGEVHLTFDDVRA